MGGQSEITTAVDASATTALSVDKAHPGDGNIGANNSMELSFYPMEPVEGGTRRTEISADEYTASYFQTPHFSKECGVRRAIPRAPRRCFPLHLNSLQPPIATPTLPPAAIDKDIGIGGGGGGERRGNGEKCNAPQNTLSTMVELQIEVLTPFVGRLMMTMWYLVLIAALTVEPIVFLSWGLVNVCGESVADMSDYEKWSSSCATVVAENNTPTLYSVRWEGGPYKVDLGHWLTRFKSIVFSFKSPDDWDDKEGNALRFPLQARLNGNLGGDLTATLPFEIICRRHVTRCDITVIPMNSVLNEVGDERWELTLFNLPERLMQGANNSSIGILFQKPAYSLGVLVWRCLFLVLSVLHLIRFIMCQKFTNMISEQLYVVVLQFFLFWYLNPFCILNTETYETSLVLQFLEFHFPSWFMAILVGFMLSVVTASMPWERSHKQRSVKCNLCALGNIGRILFRSRNIYDSPLWTKLMILFFILLVIALDLADVVCYNLTLSPDGPIRPTYVSQLIVGVLLLGGLICCCLVFYVRRNLGRKSYLDSRPQQLACRVFILIFLTAILFFIYMPIIFLTCYLTIPGMTLWQPLSHLSALMVTTFLVNIMTLVYTTRNRGGNLVPIHPRDERWKCMIWPDTWYRWLYRHGGSMYIFHNEREEVDFNWIQFNFRMRQYMAKNKRKQRNTMPHFPPGVHSTAPNALNSTVLENNTPNDNTIAQNCARSYGFMGPLSPLPNGLHPTTPTGDNNEVLNMDMTSTWFLPRPAPFIKSDSPHQSPHSRSISFGVFIPENTDMKMGGTFFDRHQNNPITLRHLQRLASQQVSFNIPIESSPHGQASDEWNFSMFQRRGQERTPFKGSNRGENDNEMLEEGYAEVNDETVGVMYKLWRAQEKIGSIIRVAERNLISRPISALAHLETFVLDAVQRPFQDVDYLPFFNLETAIDCFNLSWEAYSRVEREATKVDQRKQGILHRCRCCCCCSSSSSSSRSLSPPRVDIEPFSGLASEQREGENIEVTSGQMQPQDATDSRGAQDKSVTPKNALLPPPINVEQYGYRLYAVWEAMSVQVIISEMDTEREDHKRKVPRIVIAFRGTTNMSNAWQDMRVHRIVWEEMVEKGKTPLQRLCCRRQPTVHVGFLSIWNVHREYIHSKVREKLTAHPEVVYRVFCTGHSLGGALATLCAYSVRELLRLMKYPLTDVTVYTFGQPPLGNRAFQSAYNKAVPRTFRVVNESDAVALINMYGYHVGIEVDIDRHGNYICKPTYMERLFRPTQGKGFAVKNHLLSAYSASLSAVAKGTTCPVLPLVEFSDNHGEPHEPNSV